MERLALNSVSYSGEAPPSWKDELEERISDLEEKIRLSNEVALASILILGFFAVGLVVCATLKFYQYTRNQKKEASPTSSFGRRGDPSLSSIRVKGRTLGSSLMKSQPPPECDFNSFV